MSSTSQPFPHPGRIWLNLRAAVALVWQASPRWTLLAIALAPALALLPLAALRLFSLIIDRVGDLIARGGKSGWDEVGGLFAGIVAVAIVNELLRLLGNYGEDVMEEQVLDHVHAKLHRQSVAVDLAYYERADYHHTLYRAQKEAAYRPVAILKSLLHFGQSGLSLAAVAALLATLHWGVTLALIASTVPGLFVRLRIDRRHFLRQRQWTLADRLAWYFHELMTSAPYAKEVRLFGLGAWFLERYADVRRAVREDRLGFSRRRSALELIAQLSATLAMFGTLAWAVTRALGGGLTLGGLVLYFQVFQRGLTNLRELFAALAKVHESSLFLSDFQEFLTLENVVAEPAEARAVPTPPRLGLRFENVSFRYPGDDRQVLNGVSLDIAAGETVALVGANGAGKTTLIKLLCRLYDPTAGRVTLDGIDLRSFSLADWRRQISVLFQDYARYNLTVRENMALGRRGVADRDLQAAAEQAGAAPAIHSLPRGFETVLGHEFVDGSSLSGGEWQKVALARALLRASPLVVLDEPTSSLDAETEADILHRFRELMRGRTAIIISHRLAFAREVDRIFVLDEGRVVESGNHESLMARGGEYARIFRLQAARYHGRPPAGA